MKRLLTASGLAIIAASQASSHKPLFVEKGSASLIGDGTVSYAVYGRLDRAGDRREVHVQMKAGQTLNLELHLPDQPPERTAQAASLPCLTVVWSKGRRTLANNLRVAFDESITRTRYIRIAASRTSVTGGTYRLFVTGRRRARFAIVVGERESFGPADIVALPAVTARVRQWYRAP